MNELQSNPHAIIEVERPGFADGQSLVIYDSFQHPELFQQVSVELVTNETSEARWKFFDPNFRLIDAYASPSGVQQATIRVYLGYGQELGEPIFKGLLAQVEREASATTFIAFDMGFKMKLVKKASYKNKKNDLSILRELAKRNTLNFEGPEKPLNLEPHQVMMQDEQTDWEQAMERARAAGLVLFVRQDTLFAKYPAKVGMPILTLQNKKDFILQSGWDFIYRTPENQDGRPRRVKVRGRGKGGKRIEGQSDVSNRGRESIILKRDLSGKTNKSKLSRRAQAQKELEREHSFEGQIEIVFPPEGERLDARNTVELQHVGKLFSGKYICDGVSYQFEPGKLSVNLDLYRDAEIG